MNFKKIVSALLIAGTLSMAAPVAPAQAGIIFLPAGVGVVVLVIGIVYRSPLLIILDQNGNASQDGLEAALAQKYSAIEDRDVIVNLAAALRAKAANVAPNAKGEKLVTLDRAEILEILAPTGLAELNPAAVDQIVADMK